MKKTIIMIPSWYPTKENPISGSFFREQGLILCKYYKVIVLQFDIFSLSLMKYWRYKKKSNSIQFHIDYSDVELPLLKFSYAYLNSYIPKRFHKISNLFISPKKRTEKNMEKEIFFQKQILSEIKNKGYSPDLVFGMTAQVIADKVSFFSKINNLPYVLAEHAPFPLTNTLISSETKKAMINAAAVLAVSEDKKRQILMQNIDCNIFVVGNMVNENMFIKQSEEPNIFTIIIIAAFNFYKDYKTFFSVIKYLKDSNSHPFNVKIVGFNPYNSKSEWSLGEEDFLNLFNSYSITDVCELIPYATRDEIPALLSSVNVFVMTSIQEGFPVSALEASCVGIPVYSTKCGGVEDYIDDKMGRIFNLGDWKNIGDSIIDLMENKIKFDATYIRNKTVSLYGTEAFLKRLSTIFNSVLK